MVARDEVNLPERYVHTQIWSPDMTRHQVHFGRDRDNPHIYCELRQESLRGQSSAIFNTSLPIAPLALVIPDAPAPEHRVQRTLFTGSIRDPNHGTLGHPFHCKQRPVGQLGCLELPDYANSKPATTAQCRPQSRTVQVLSRCRFRSHDQPPQGPRKFGLCEKLGQCCQRGQ